jgi:hypothetical protein
MNGLDLESFIARPSRQINGFDTRVVPCLPECPAGCPQLLHLLNPLLPIFNAGL